MPFGWGLKSYPFAGRSRAKTGVPSFRSIRSAGITVSSQGRGERKRYPGEVGSERVTSMVGRTGPPSRVECPRIRSGTGLELGLGISLDCSLFRSATVSGIVPEVVNVNSPPPAGPGQSASDVSTFTVTFSDPAKRGSGWQITVRLSSETRTAYPCSPLRAPAMLRISRDAAPATIGRSVLMMMFVPESMYLESGRGERYLTRGFWRPPASASVWKNRQRQRPEAVNPARNFTCPAFIWHPSSLSPARLSCLSSVHREQGQWPQSGSGRSNQVVL